MRINEKIRNIITISLITMLTGQFYIEASGSGFRLTLVVFFMSLFLLYFEEYNIFLITFIVGISTMSFRTIIDYLESSQSFIDVFLNYLPVLSYYILFGVLFKLLDIRRRTGNPVIFFLNLWICDAVPDIVEASIRKAWLSQPFNYLLVKIIAVGAITSLVTVLLYNIGSRYLDRFRENEKETHYREIIVFISKLKTELFILNKSREDIENTMASAYKCYDTMEDETFKKPLLEIAKSIHEIKKDYLRVIAGMNSIFNNDSKETFMSIKDILSIVKDNAKKISESRGKKITFNIDYNTFFLTDKYYSLISILNNLTINSIDAIDSFGVIDIRCRIAEHQVFFLVQDTGEGIPEDKLDIIFNTGYTTKYNKETGEMSTGLGLSHIKYIMEFHFGGSIKVESERGKGTLFQLEMPRVQIIKEGE